MSDRTPLLLVGALAAVALLLGVVNLGSAPDAVPGDSTSGPVGAAVSTTDLVTRVAALEAEVKSLRAELDERLRRRRGRGGRGDAGPDELEVSDAELARRIGRATVEATGGKEALIEALDEGDPEVEDRIGAMVRDQLEEERDARAERRMERMEERSRRRIDELAEQAGLDEAQVTVLNDLLSAERDQIHTLFRAAREDGSWMDAREKAGEIRAQTDASVGESLSGDALDAWQEMRDEEQARRRR